MLSEAVLRDLINEPFSHSLVDAAIPEFMRGHETLTERIAAVTTLSVCMAAIRFATVLADAGWDDAAIEQLCRMALTKELRWES